MRESKSDYSPPKFSLALLHPKHALVWFGFGLLALIVNLLPYKLLYLIGRKLGQLSMSFSKKRVKVAKRNVELAFPDKSEKEVNEWVEDNFKNTGLALIETGIAWFWPTWRFKRIVNQDDLSAVENADETNKGVLLCCVHALNLEITARAFAVLGFPGYGAFRPHNNPAYNFIQYWGRTHNGNKLIDRKDLKQMIRVLRTGERLFYLPDHDYGRNKSVFVPFFGVEDACTTTGTSILVNAGQCDVVLGSGFRNSDGKYDTVAAESLIEDYPTSDVTDAAAYMNRHLEDTILRAPTQWMWLHKRYKTMEDMDFDKGYRYQVL